MTERDKIEQDTKQPQEIDKFNEIDQLNKVSREIRHLDVSQSIQHAKDAYQLSVKAQYEKGMADSLSNKAFHEIQLSNLEQAFEHLFQAIQIYKKIGAQKELSFPLYLLGLTYNRLSDYKKALEYLLQSKEISAKEGDKLLEAQALLNIARIYSSFNDVANAISNALLSLSYARELKDKEHERYSLMIIGLIYLDANDFENSIYYLNESLKIESRSGELNNNVNYSRIGKWYAKQGQYEKALTYYNQLLASAISQKHTYVQVMTMLDIATCYEKLNRISDAEILLKDALVLVDSINYKGVLTNIHKQLAEIYKSQKNYDLALFHFEKFHSLKEEVNSIEAAAQLKNINILSKLELSEKDAEIERLRNVELKNANQELTETIDALTKLRISKLATTLTLIVAVILFVLSEGFLDPIVDSYSHDLLFNLSTKLAIALMLKPIESFMEKMMLSYAAKKKRQSRVLSS